MYQDRPTGVSVISVLFFIGGALGVLSGLLALATTIPAVDPLTRVVASYQIVIGIAGIIVGGLYIAIGWGLWTLQEWARIGAIILLALAAIANLFVGVGFLAGVNIGGVPLSLPGPGIASLLIAGLEAWAIWYLLTSDVEVSFTGGMPPEPVPPTMPATPPPPPPPEAAVSQPPPRPEPSARPARPPTMPMEPRAAPEGWLVLRSGSRRGQQFGLKRGRNTVGRDSSRADIVLEEETVSNEHAHIQFEQGQFYVYDLASTNGTYVNNRRVQKQMLMDGDVLRFGNVQTVFKRVD